MTSSLAASSHPSVALAVTRGLHCVPHLTTETRSKPMDAAPSLFALLLSLCVILAVALL